MGDEFEVVEEVLESEVQEQEQEQTSEIEQNDRIPLNKYLDEKKRRKELERKLREFEDKTTEHETITRMESVREKVKSKGYDEDLADLFEEITKDIYSNMPKVDKMEKAILEELEDYVEENPEALKHKKEIVEKVKKYRKADPDFSIDDALNLIKPAKIRVGELKTDIEQKQAISRRNAENKKVINDSGSNAPKNLYPLDESDKKALEGLQKMMPDKNWTAEKYYKTMKG